MVVGVQSRDRLCSIEQDLAKVSCIRQYWVVVDVNNSIRIIAAPKVLWIYTDLENAPFL